MACLGFLWMQLENKSVPYIKKQKCVLFKYTQSKRPICLPTDKSLCKYRQIIVLSVFSVKVNVLDSDTWPFWFQTDTEESLPSVDQPCNLVTLCKVKASSV